MCFEFYDDFLSSFSPELLPHSLLNRSYAGFCFRAFWYPFHSWLNLIDLSTHLFWSKAILSFLHRGSYSPTIGFYYSHSWICLIHHLLLHFRVLLFIFYVVELNCTVLKLFLWILYLISNSRSLLPFKWVFLRFVKISSAKFYQETNLLQMNLSLGPCA